MWLESTKPGTKRSPDHSQPGYMPGLKAGSHIERVQEAVGQCFSLIIDVSISLSLPLSKKTNENVFKEIKTGTSIHQREVIPTNSWYHAG